MATHSSILAWEVPWTEEPDGLQSLGSRRVGHDRVTEHAHIPRNLLKGEFLLTCAFHWGASRVATVGTDHFYPFGCSADIY